MSLYVTRNHVIDKDTRNLISKRYKAITKAINGDFWNSTSDTAHSRYVGSYGRGTAIDTSDLDVMVELPDSEYIHFSSLKGNEQSRLLQSVRSAIKDTYSTTNVKADGQVVVIRFSDGMKFEILPAFKNYGYWGQCDGTYKYPDTNMGGNWLSTNPLAEQEAMEKKNEVSNGLLFDTCKHIRYIRDNYYSSYHLSGIVIDSFVYVAMGAWRYTPAGESSAESGSYEKVLLDYYNQVTCYGIFDSFSLSAPGSNMKVDTKSSSECLGKVLNKMVG